MTAANSDSFSNISLDSLALFGTKNSKPATSSNSDNHDLPVTDPFIPLEPKSFEDIELTANEMEGLVLRHLMQLGTNTGRKIASHIKLPFSITVEVLQKLRQQLYCTLKGNAGAGDYDYELTPAGVERARLHSQRGSYSGSCPVSLSEYRKSIMRQSVKNCAPSFEDIKRAYSDMVLPTSVLGQIGQAICSGRSVFLFGSPGNGKSSLAERAMEAIGEAIWIPRALSVNGEIIRIFEPHNHVELPLPPNIDQNAERKIDQRWMRIKRPTIIVGGELDRHHLEFQVNEATGICEAPLQMKSNCGCMVIDDFGRQRIPHTELLNRWIIPLEKGHDYLTLPSGRVLKVPVEQLVVFSTNLQPRDLCDEAFLRRLAYKIEVFGPSEDAFKRLFASRAQRLGFSFEPSIVDYVVSRLKERNKELKYCYPNDILQQVRDFCRFVRVPLELTRDRIDVAVNNYFANL